MQTGASIAAIVAAVAIGAVSPGPSFILVARTSVSSSRAAGLACSLGVGVGGLLFSVAALLGLHLVLGAVPMLYTLIRAAGGAYLLWLGWNIWRGARQGLPAGDVGEGLRGRSFSSGLVTQLSNPKAIVVYAGIFTALLPPSLPLLPSLLLPLLLFIVEAGWYSIVAYALSSAAPRAAYLRCKCWIDWSAGALMIALALKLALSIFQS